MVIATSTTMPCRLSLIIFPNVHANANGIMASSHRIRMLVSPFGFSSGWPKLAPK